MDPPANSLIAPGSTVTLFVSKGPTQSTVPDVTSFSRADAIATLRNSGFKVVVDVSDTDDPTLDGVVMTQTPGPGETAKPTTTDVMTFATVPVILIVTALLATYIPALRATRVDPTVALREE
jgi:serine/threonine-protein kinase